MLYTCIVRVNLFLRPPKVVPVAVHHKACFLRPRLRVPLIRLSITTLTVTVPTSIQDSKHGWPAPTRVLDMSCWAWVPGTEATMVDTLKWVSTSQPEFRHPHLHISNMTHWYIPHGHKCRCHYLVDFRRCTVFAFCAFSGPVYQAS